MARSIYKPDAFCSEFTRVIRSSRLSGAVRACILTTRDRSHALSMVRKTVLECKVPLYHFTVAGRSRYNPDTFRWEPVGAGSMDGAGLLTSARDLRGGGVVVLEDCALFLQDQGGNLAMRMTLAQMLSGETPSDWLVLVLLEPPESASRLPGILADQFVRLDLPYPRVEELESLAMEEVATLLHRKCIVADIKAIQQESSRLASGMVGLTRSAARDSLRDALAPNLTDFRGACERLEQRKSQQLSRELAMNVLDTLDVEEPIGLDYLVEDLRISRDRMRKTGLGRARGILLVGPPGTGKTMLARSIGKVVELPVVEFRISSLMNSLLGETEQRFSRAFDVLETLSPNVVFIDEIEKAFGDSSERDGGTMMRVTGSLLSWLSDNPYPNFIVATSNSLSRMGEVGLTMTRSERFDAAYFVDVPNLVSREKMLSRWLSPLVHGYRQLASDLALKTEKFSGADLFSVVKKAAMRAEHSPRSNLITLLNEEIEKKHMRALVLYDQFRELRAWGRMYCDPAGPTDD